MPIFFICFIVFIIWLRVKYHSAEKQSSFDEEFWAREQKSNFVRKKDISNLDYLTPDLSKLPFLTTPPESEKDLQNEVQAYSKKKMINLNGYSNTDLKLTYGPANLEELSTYDQNFSLFIRSINHWGCTVYDNGDLTRAKTILLYALNLGSDLSSTYITLAKIYCAEDQPEQIEELLHQTDHLNPLLQESIQNQLQKILLSCYQ